MLCPGDAQLVRRDSGLPALATLLDAAAFAAMLENHSGTRITHATPTYLRYKPATSCLVAYDVRIGGHDAPVPVYARTHARDDADVKLANASDHPAIKGPLGSGALVIRDPPLAMFVFPNDHELGALSRLHDPQDLSHLLGKASSQVRGRKFRSVEQLRYKPERRFVGRATTVDGDFFFIKLYTPGEAPAHTANARAFESRGPLRVARFLGAYERRGVAVWEWVHGKALDPQANDLTPACARTGEALALLHAQHAAVPPAYASPRLAEILAESVHSISAILPEARPRADRLASSLHTWSQAGSPAALHGDFNPGQVLLTDDSVAVLDFDRAGLGPAELDLGNFLANVELLALSGEAPPSALPQCREGLLEGYRRSHPRNAGEIFARLDHAAAFAMLRLAVQPFRTRRADWPELLHSLLTRAEVLVGRA